MATMHTLKKMSLLLLLVITNSMYAQTGSNPIFRDVFTADPAPMVYDEKLYVYVGHDEAFNDEMFNITEWLCYSTDDMINWTAHGSVMRPEDFKWDANDPNAVQQAWAAQCVHKDGKFYLYTTVTYGGRNVGVAVSDSPTGPFVDARGSALISDGMTNNGDAWDDIDPTVLIDDDGTAYLSWGNPNCYLAKLKPNMTELDGPIEIITPQNYGEGPWLSKRNGLYYLTYAAFPDPNGSEQICYATATNIYGPWEYQGIVSGPAANSYTIHPGLINYKGNDYLFYHDADYVIDGVRGKLGLRSVCVEYLCYNEDGTMQPITHTDAGITVPPPCPSNQYPVINFTSPENTNFVVPETLTIDVDVTDADGTISNVFYYLNDELIQEEWVAPYGFEYTIETAGDYTLRAVATDDGGATGTATLNLSANVPQGPYGGTPHVIPGTIQLENYDVGGNGFAYFDIDEGTNVNPAPNFRTDEDVDIEICSDIINGYNLGWTNAGEWLEYTVHVASTGKYNLLIRSACNGDDRTISFAMDDNDITGNIAIPNTLDWQEWTDVQINDIELQAGEHILKLAIGDVDYVNLNYIVFEQVNVPPTVNITAPLDQNVFTADESVLISATATSENASIVSVNYYANVELLGANNSSPYSFIWEHMTEGIYTIKVEAEDNSGLKSYDEITVTINPAPIVLQLKTGWNLIGYPHSETQTIETALESIWSEVEAIKDFEGFYDKNGDSALNSISQFEFTKGYYIKVYTDCELIW